VKRLTVVAVGVVGLGLFGTGLRGVTEVDGRLSDAAERPPVRELDVKQEIRAPGDCPAHKRPEKPAPRGQLAL
jgi:hypothetical protein